MGMLRDPASITGLRVPTFKPMELMVEASPRRTFANAHTYHINSISINSDQETYMSADDLRINLWHLEITDQSFSILLRKIWFSISLCCLLLLLKVLRASISTFITMRVIGISQDEYNFLSSSVGTDKLVCTSHRMMSKMLVRIF